MSSTRFILRIILILGVSEIAMTESSILAPESGYQASDILTSVYFDGYDTYGNNVVGWTDASLKIYNKNGTEIVDLGSPVGYVFGWNNFVKLDSSGDSAWVGMSVSNNSDDRIYQVNLITGIWTYKATIGGNFDIDFYGENAFVSALDEEVTMGNTCIWLMDTTGSNNHDLIAAVGGNSAGIAFDDLGDLYYTTNGIASGDSLVRYSQTQVASSIGIDSLLLSDAEKLSDISGGAYDTAIDDSGNVLFSANGLNTSYAAIWNGDSGSGVNYDAIGFGYSQWGNWYRFIDCEGDITSGGYLYQTDFYFNGIAQVSIPEPITLLFLGFGGVLIRQRRT